ncbi:hypothetical protein [Streptomyces sp. NPDC097619]|uniref:hypothetical protein n=1 Tax=Streptomyces sp. NPDC097619 TaxID=3157228 RepID=UPI0033275AED
MTTRISTRAQGGTIHRYELLGRVEELGLTSGAAHAAIHDRLDELVSVDGEEDVILARTPIHPTLETSNSPHGGRCHWLVVSDTTAKTILDAITARLEPDRGDL